MKSIIVLSTPQQIAVFQKQTPSDSIMVYCDNESLYPMLEARKIAFEKLDEFLIRDQWAAMNAWGCGQAAGWIRACKHLTPAHSPDILPGIYLYFSCLLIAAAKNYAMAKHLMEICRPEQVFVFEKIPGPAFPVYSGNAFLNYFLREMAVKRGVPVQVLSTASIGCGVQTGSAGQRASVSQILKKITVDVLARLPSRASGKYLLVYGSLRHLESVVNFLHQKGIAAIVYDDEFHGDIFRFAVSRKMPYVTAGQLIVPPQDVVKFRRESLREQLLTKFAEAKRQGYFRFGGYDLSGFIQEMIFGTIASYLEGVATEWYRCEDLLIRFSVLGCLVEEDYHGRANFCEYMKHSGVENFCISHGHGAYDFAVNSDQRCFSQSTTFVNSEHEKLKMYGTRGWDLAPIVVSGTPRYDQLFQFMVQSKSRPPHLKRILYCPGSLSLSTPDALGFIGLGIYECKLSQGMAFRSFIEAAEGLPVEIMVKSHYDSDNETWKQYVKQCRSKVKIKFFKHSENFNSLLVQSQAVILSCLSTVLIEAGLCRVPVIFVDLCSQNSPSALEFAAHGLCRYATSVEAIRRELEKIVQHSEAPNPLTESDASREYFLGKKFGSATQRTGEIILKRLTDISSGRHPL